MSGKHEDKSKMDKTIIRFPVTLLNSVTTSQIDKNVTIEPKNNNTSDLLQFTDVIIKIDDVKFETSRYMLSVNSDYFRSLFKTKNNIHNKKRKLNNELEKEPNKVIDNNDTRNIYDLTGKIDKKYFDMYLQLLFTNPAYELCDSNIVGIHKIAVYTNTTYMIKDCMNMIKIGIHNNHSFNFKENDLLYFLLQMFEYDINFFDVMVVTFMNFKDYKKLFPNTVSGQNGPISIYKQMPLINVLRIQSLYCGLYKINKPRFDNFGIEVNKICENRGCQHCPGNKERFVKIMNVFLTYNRFDNNPLNPDFSKTQDIKQLIVDIEKIYNDISALQIKIGSIQKIMETSGDNFEKLNSLQLLYEIHPK